MSTNLKYKYICNAIITVIITQKVIIHGIKQSIKEHVKLESKFIMSYNLLSNYFVAKQKVKVINI